MAERPATPVTDGTRQTCGVCLMAFSAWVRNIFRICTLLIALILPVCAAADHLPFPTGKIILTITGPMHDGNVPGGAVFDQALLQKLGTTSFKTSTQWTDGVADFKGISLRVLLDQIKADPKTLEVIAINEYRVEVPASDAIPGGPILAWQQGGTLLSVREKGPLWLIYPYDTSAAFRTEEVYARSVWQVVKINLLP